MSKMTARNPKDGFEIAVVIPVFGDGKALPALVSRMDDAFAKKELNRAKVILIDDCGDTESWTTISQIAEQRENTLGIQLRRNFGQHNALMCGFQETTEDIVITIDDDLQQEPESIPILIHYLIDNDLDLVYGTYFQKKHGAGRNIGSWIIQVFNKFLFKIPVKATSFRAIRSELVNSVIEYHSSFVYLDGLLAWHTTRIGGIVIPHHKRANGESGYTISKLLELSLNVFTNFSLLPLRLVTFTGVAAATSGFCLGTYYMLNALFRDSIVPGFASIIITILILGGIQMLSLGVIGEYLGRVHINANGKPQFAIRKRIAPLATNAPQTSTAASD